MVILLLINLLVSNALTLRQEKSILFSRVVFTGLISSSILGFINLYVNALSNGIGLYGGLFNVTTFTQAFNIFILLISALILILTGFFPRKVIIKKYSSLYHLLFSKLSYNKNVISNKTGEQFRIIEYALVIVFALCGSLFLMSTGDLVSIFLSIELQSYGLYILCSLYRDSESSTASALTYFLLGGLSSCFILLGSALLYANSGTTNLDNIYIICSISEMQNDHIMGETINTISSLYLYQPYYFHISLIIIAVGFLFKVSAAPFHFWSPDVYDGIPTIVTTFVAIIAKISIFVFFLELVYYTQYSFLSYSWTNVFVISSFFSLIIGSVLGLTQFRIKRLFAYSTISHVGFILLALCMSNTESIQAYIFYIIQYSLSNLNAFVILVSVGYTFYFYIQGNEKGYKGQKIDKESEMIDENHSPIQLISQIRGYFYVNSFLAMSLGITLFSFVGIPPLIGFFAKQMILSAAMDNGYVFMSLVAILTSVIGAAYYLSLIKEIFFFKHDYVINPVIYKEGSYMVLKGYITYLFSFLPSSKNISTKQANSQVEFSPNDIKLSSSLSSVISVITLLLVAFIYVPSEWFNVVSILSLSLFKA